MKKTIPTTPPVPSRLRELVLGCAALAVLTLVAYWPAVGAGFIWDDDAHVTNNALLHSAPGLVTIWSVIGATPQYYPVTHTSFWLECHLWGLGPLGYHVDNILLQAANAILLWVILRRLKVAGAWVVAAIFAVHPMQVESVAWVTERKNVLSGFFFLLSLWTYLSFAWPRWAGSGRGTPRRSAWKYVVSLGLFVLALLSKSVTGTLPGVVLVLTWWKRGRLTRRDVIPLLPFVALAIAMGSLTGWIEKHIVGAMGPEFEFSAWQRVGIAGRAVWFYAGKFLFPWPLMFIYPRWKIGPANWPALVFFPIAVGGALATLWVLRRRIGRGALAAALVFIGMLFPALGFVNVFPMRYSFVADHFQYLACAAMAALVVGAAAWLLPQRARAPIAAIVLLILVTLTWNRAEVFHDPQTLWLDTLSKNPTSFIAHNDYGLALLHEGNFDAAEPQFLETLRLNPWDTYALLNMGLICRHRHQYASAEGWYMRALASIPQNSPQEATPAQTAIWTELGADYEQEAAGNVDSPQYVKSVQAYRQALSYSPDDQSALLALAQMLSEQKGLTGTEPLYLYAIRDDPNSSVAHYHLGKAYLARHDWQDAIAEFRMALSIDPTSAPAAESLRQALDARAHSATGGG